MLKKYTHHIIKKRGYTMSFHCLIRTVREIHGQVLKFIYITEVLHTYFLAKNPRSKLWLFGYQQKTRAHTHKKNNKYIFLCDSVFKNIQKENYEHQMFTRCQHETTSIFLLVDIAKCFSPRHGTTHVRM